MFLKAAPIKSMSVSQAGVRAPIGLYLSMCLSTITSASASQHAQNACIIQMHFVSQLSVMQRAVKSHKKVGGTVVCFPPAAELK